MNHRMNTQAVGRTPAYARTNFVGLDFRPGKFHFCGGPVHLYSLQEVMELQKGAMHGVEVGLSPCASGLARFVSSHKYL